jgi:hypothetical protein
LIHGIFAQNGGTVMSSFEAAPPVVFPKFSLSRFGYPKKLCVCRLVVFASQKPYSHDEFLI